MDREALGLPPDLPAPSAVEVVNNEGAVVGGDAAAIVVDPASLPPDAPGVLPMSKGGEEVVASLPTSLSNAREPATPLNLDLPPPALNTSPMHSPVLAEPVSKASTPGLSKGAAGFFQSLRHSASSKASMVKEKESREKEVIPPLPPTPLLNGDFYTNGHAQAIGVKEKEGKEGVGVGVGSNIFRRSLRTKKREPISVHPALVEGSSAIPASPHLPSSVPPSPKHYRRPSGSQVQPAPALAADETNNAVPPPLPLPASSLPLPTRGSTLDDTNATASMSSSWTSASICPSGPGPGSGPGPLAPVALPPLPFTPPMSLIAQDSELPLPVLPLDRVPSPAGSSSGRTGTGTGAGIGNPTRSSHSKSNSSEFSPIPDPFSTQNGNNNNNNNNNRNSSGQGQLTPSVPWVSTTPASVPAPLASPRAFKLSLGGSEAKRSRAAARTATEDAQAREREREKKVLEEKTRKAREREEREKWIRLEKEKEREEKEKEKEEKEKQVQQQSNKPQKRKMSLSGMTVVGRLGASFGWNKDKDKHADKDKGTTGIPPLPQPVPRRSQHSNEAEQDLPPPERLPGYLAIGASPRFIV
jgi:hypothetical protein